jgi:hypothetical protein
MSTTNIVYRKTPFVLQDSSDNTKKINVDLSNLSEFRQLTVSDDDGGILRTSNRDSYRFFGGLTSGVTIGSGWTLIDFQTSGFIGAADPSNAWDSDIKGYIVSITGYYSVSLQVAMGTIGGSGDI